MHLFFDNVNLDESRNRLIKILYISGLSSRGRSACLCKLYWQYLCRSWWSSGMIPEKMSWVWFPARISTVYSKLPSVNALVFKFLVKYLHICSYKFSYRISDQEICSAMLCWFCNSNFFILLCWFGHSNKNPILGHISKVVNSGYKNYVICISQNDLSPFSPFSEIDCYQVIFVFLFRFLLSVIFASLYQYSY